ncbi:hypothetical protein NPIL_272791 [Nephila pilipes]|uniref:Uncharacterized protein n=1 Tax=Nephila pilipes TaxID=299642 RepID=A0A8X6QVP1_NEPPI|nr:hypothetical protein NPIL_272791 [Nephila pilipes]
MRTENRNSNFGIGLPSKEKEEPLSFPSRVANRLCKNTIKSDIERADNEIPFCITRPKENEEQSRQNNRNRNTAQKKKKLLNKSDTNRLFPTFLLHPNIKE